MAEPTYIVCPESCTVTVVHELALPPLQLDAAAGGAVALAVMGVWAIGWAIRMIVRAMAVDEGVPPLS